MAQPYDQSASPSFAVLIPRLRRYLPLDMVEDLTAPADTTRPVDRMLEAFVHLAAARYTIATYLPRLLTHQLLEERLHSPWLRWVEGSLLFADLSGSTALAEKLSTLGREGTELVTEFLNDIFATMIEVIQNYGGDLVSFGGDALLVFFGDERHPRTATRAALALQEALHGYVRTVPGVGSFPMHLHIGVESGRVAFVSAGEPHALFSSVLGATVNGVAAAESHAGSGEVVVGPGAWAIMAEYGEGQLVAPGFVRVSTMRAPVRPHDPLPDELVAEFNPLQAIPRLLDDLDRISPYVPPVLLERIVADPQRPQVEADLRPVTVLFAQITGLEELAESLAPEHAAQALQALVGTMQQAVERFGGVVNKLDVADEGIKLVAIFGAPAAYEDHADRAARAALEMQASLLDVNTAITRLVQNVWPAELALLDATLRQRIGLNLGTAFAGNVGSVTRKEYTVMGDAVNVAARVMSKAVWGEIWCSEAATHAIAERMDCEARGSIALKGKAQPLPLFRLVGEHDAPTAIVMRDDSPFVGRKRELAWLIDQLREASSGAGRAVRIVGEAGVGKSRLTTELLEEATARDVRVLGAVCFSHTVSSPYAAWSEWLKALCGITTGENEELRTYKLAERLAELGPGMDEWLPIMGDLVRLDVPDNRLTRGLDPQMRQTRRFELIEQLLWRAAESEPVLVLFEDFHWADATSLDLWQRIAARLGWRPIMLLAAHRPSLVAGELEDAAHVLELRELSVEESVEMAGVLTNGEQLSELELRKVVGRAAGNPLFLAELLRAMNDQRRAIDDLPDSLNGLLLSRIDRLDETSRGVLRVASVIGQRIPFGVLRSIQTTDQQVLLRQLGRLDEHQMTVLERVEPERVHAFRHALIQEVAYQSMLYARRRELHGRIGAYLERRYGDDLDDYYALLAHHYRLSDRRDKAIEYLLKAGHAARDVYANDDAIQHYLWALDALAGDESDPRAWEARDALGDVYATVGRYDDALEQHAAILVAPQVTAEAARRAHRKRGSVLEKQGQYAAAMEELERAMAIARSGVPGISLLAIPVISADIGLVHQRRGEYDLAISACQEGLQSLRHDPHTREDELIEARLYSTLGAIYGMRGDYPSARHYFERSLQVREAIDDLPGMIISRNNLGYLWQLQSEYERALENYQMAEELSRRINWRYTLMFAVLNTAWALTSQGAYDEAEARCVEALALSREINAQHNVAQSYNTLGVVAFHKGEYERALQMYEAGLELIRKLESTPQEGSMLVNMAVTLNAQGRFEEAHMAAERALSQAEALQSRRLKVEALNALADAALGSQDIVLASRYAGEAADISHAISSKHDEGVARRTLGRAAALQHAPFAAHFEQSATLFLEIKDHFELGRTWAAYGAALLAGGQSDALTYLKQARDAFVSVGAHGELRRLASLLERSV